MSAVSAGTKLDAGKPRWTLVPWDSMRGVLAVLEHGATKYAPDNWKFVSNPRERYANAAMRHMTAWLEGERCDDESGLSHLAHAVCCLLFLLHFDRPT